MILEYKFKKLCEIYTCFQVTPVGMRKLLAWVKKTYNNPDIIITENGFSDNGTYGDDATRKLYYQVYYRLAFLLLYIFKTKLFRLI